MKGFVYSIRSKSRPDLVYYGSTKQKLCKRMAIHRYGAKNGKSCSSKQILLLGDAYIELEETVEYNDKEELRKVEFLYIRQEECVNKQGKGTNKEKAKARDAAKYQAHKEKYLKASRKQRESRDPVAWAVYCREYYLAHKI